MKKNSLLHYLLIPPFILIGFNSLSAQIEKRNLLQVKLNFNYFLEEPKTIYWYTPLYYPDISYKRFLKSKQSFFEFEFDNVYFDYLLHQPGSSDIGKPIFRNHFLFGAKYGRYLTLTPNTAFFLKGGLVYRIGTEHRVSSVGQVGQFTEIGVKTNYYNDLGVSASIELLYKMGEHWYLSFDLGGERFITRKVTTKEQLRVGVGIGYAF